MKVNIVSESEYFPAKDHGVHTAYLTTVEMAKHQKVDVVTNSFGKADITHIHTIGLLGLFKLLTNTPAVVTAHLVPESFVGSLKGSEHWLWLAKWYLRFFYNHAELVMAVAPRVKEQLTTLGVTTRIEVMPNPVNNTVFKKDAELRKKGRKILGVTDDTFVFISVGQVQPRKGVGDFIELAKKFPEAKFFWIGGRPFKALTADDRNMNDLLENPPPNFALMGPFTYTDMPAVVNAADAFLFPSYQENAPMAPIEGAACGLPLILRDLPEYKLLYEEGYVSCKDTHDFEKAIRRLMHEKEYYHTWSKNSETLAKKYSIDILGHILIGYYQSLL